jgi:hypothetical protein
MLNSIRFSLLNSAAMALLEAFMFNNSLWAQPKIMER